MSTGRESKPLFFIDGEIKIPPFTRQARQEAGELFRLLQDGHQPEMPRSRPMPSIGPGVHKLRSRDTKHKWRIFDRIDHDVILIIGVFGKKTEKTPKHPIDLCQKRLLIFDR